MSSLSTSRVLRGAAPCCLVWLVLPACSADATGGNAAGGGAAGAPSSVPSAGSSGAIAATAGASGSASTGHAGSSAGGAAGAAGAPSPAAGAGGGDDGHLFGPDKTVPYDPSSGAAGSSGSAGGGSTIPGDGNSVTSKIGGNVNGTAAFTQTGTDVTVVIKLTKCPDGTLGIHLNDGLSCDNAGTEGKVWDGKRGNIGDNGTISCTKNSASLTYTRSGADPATKWTVGDHSSTDLSKYVVIVNASADTSSSFIGCGNFFL